MRYVQGIQVTKEGGEGERRGGAKRQHKNNLGPLWKISRKLKGGGGLVGRWACSRTATRRERKSGWVFGMMGLRKETIMWANDLVWQ